MREFAYGRSEQFAALDQELSAGKKYRFSDRELPGFCTPDRATLWFAKEEGMYSIYIDKGITANVEDNGFIDFLEKGVRKFSCLDDMIGFLRSFQTYFPNPVEPAQSEVVDKEKLREIRESEDASPVIWPEDLAAPLKRKVFGQDRVIDALADKVVINRMRRDKKLLTIALVGPTATGKSETAKSLAEVMSVVYGVEYGYIEIAGSEFIGEHTVHRFFGAPPGYIGHGQATILEPVRNNPYHVIVINEIEKADEKILVGLMEAIDTGFIGMADNSGSIDLNCCIMLFTSNIPIDMKEYESLGDFERGEMCRDAFTKHCGRPEISGKIGNFLVFDQLNAEATTDIIIKFVREELDSYDLKLGHIDEYLMADFLKHQTKYGARGIKGLVGDSVGRHLLRTRRLEMFKGRAIKMSGTIENIEFDLI